MKKQKQLSFSFYKQRRDVAQFDKYLQACKRLVALLVFAQIVVSIGIIWIRTI